jgi:hemerythrin-like domain-containing protein
MRRMSHEPESPPASGPFDRFRHDHADVHAWLDALERWQAGVHAGTASPLPPEAVSQLERRFESHMAAEDAVLFPALADAFPASRPTLRQLESDHAELHAMLRVLAACVRGEPDANAVEQAAVAARDFVDLLRLHIRREEVAVFDVATRALGRAEIEALTARLDARVAPEVKRGAADEPPRGAAS